MYLYDFYFDYSNEAVTMYFYRGGVTKENEKFWDNVQIRVEFLFGTYPPHTH